MPDGNRTKTRYQICQYWQPYADYEKCYLADITACGGNPSHCNLPDSMKDAYREQIFRELKDE